MFSLSASCTVQSNWRKHCINRTDNKVTIFKTLKLKYSPCLGEESKLNDESMRWDPFLVKSSDSKGFCPWGVQ